MTMRDLAAIRVLDDVLGGVPAAALALGGLAACSPDIPDPTQDLLGSATDVAADTGADPDDGESTGSPPGTGDDGDGGSTTGEPGGESSSEGGNQGQLCGNGLIEGTEECDCAGGVCTVEGLGGRSCYDVAGENPDAPGPPTGGALACTAASCKLDIASCTYCGDRVLNGDETCELDLPIEASCSSLGAGAVGALECGSDCQIDTAACTDCGAEFDFSMCGGGVLGVDWVATIASNGGAPTSSWGCGSPEGAGAPAGATGVWGTNLAGEYQPHEASALQSPALDFTACDEPVIEMRLRHWFDFDHSGPVADDGAIVQVSSGINGPWTTIQPTGGVPYSGGTIGATLPPVAGAHGFAFNSGGWIDSTFDLGPWADAPLYVRFVVGSDGSDQAPGWYLDNVEIIGLSR